MWSYLDEENTSRAAEFIMIDTDDIYTNDLFGITASGWIGTTI